LTVDDLKFDVVWPIGVYGGWRALLGLVIVVVGFTGIILAMIRWTPGVNPAFVLIPLTAGLVVVAWLQEDRQEHPPDDPGDSTTPGL
jgi:hypothetical protein